MVACDTNPNRSGDYELPTYPFVEPPELRAGKRARYRVVIVGGGLCGLTAACELAARGVEAVLLDEDDTVGVRGASSRGICYAQKSLEIFDRLGIYARIEQKGVTWSKGKTLAGEDEVYSFNLESARVSKQPPFINLQQFYLEWFLVDRIVELGNVELRWKNKVEVVSQSEECVSLTVSTPAGRYELEAEWVIDAAGLHSAVRDSFALDTHADKSADRWCITDVRFKKPLPIERWTWVEAPFNGNRAVWQHLMADAVWRMDFQMAPDSDPEYVSRRDVAEARLRDQLGPGVEFDLVWVGPYSYRSTLLDEFRLGRVFFIGDSAHVVSPFGARGGNTGIQDAANLCWKLALVMQDQAPARLLDTYSAERQPAAAENLKVTRRTARFLAPANEAEHTLRRAVLSLAREYAFARPLVNTGRMSVANDYPGLPWFVNGGYSVQNVALTLPGGSRGSLGDLLGNDSMLVGILFGSADAAHENPGWNALATKGLPLRLVACSEMLEGLPAVQDPDGRLAGCVHAQPASFCLIRPDGYLAAHIANATPAEAEAAVNQALLREQAS